MLAGLLALTFQHSLRLAANDPQIELAEDISLRLARGADPQTILTQPAINLRTSVSTYVMVFNRVQEPVVVTALLDNQEVKPPVELFNLTEKNGQTRFTWQPAPGVKSAVVMQYFDDQQTGYLLVGRSLRETDYRITEITQTIMAGWLMIMALSLVCTIVMERISFQGLQIKSRKNA